MNISGPSSLAGLIFTVPSHMYSIINFEDPDADADGLESEDLDEEDTDREDAALNPSRSNTASSHGTDHSRSSARERERTRRVELSNAQSASSSSPPHSPLSPETRLPS